MKLLCVNPEGHLEIWEKLENPIKDVTLGLLFMYRIYSNQYKKSYTMGEPTKCFREIIEEWGE